MRVVLTAHPTQFYPGNALAIITDLAKAMEENDLVSIRKLLHQLGLTPFFNSEPPTPYDEACAKPGTWKTSSTTRRQSCMPRWPRPSTTLPLKP